MRLKGKKTNNLKYNNNCNNKFKSKKNLNKIIKYKVLLILLAKLKNNNNYNNNHPNNYSYSKITKNPVLL